VALEIKKYHFDANQITDWESFHDLFATTCGFPGYYGRNMDAWIDCTTDMASEDVLVVFEVSNMGSLKTRCHDQFLAIVECSAFVNHRLLECGETPGLILSFE